MIRQAIHLIFKWGSVLSFIATLILWVRSYYHDDQFRADDGRQDVYYVGSDWGRVRFGRIVGMRRAGAGAWPLPTDAEGKAWMDMFCGFPEGSGEWVRYLNDIVHYKELQPLSQNGSGGWVRYLNDIVQYKELQPSARMPRWVYP